MTLPVLAADLGPGVVAGFTTRAGGVSRGPWQGLDLGLHVGDDPSLVARNRALLQEWLGVPVRYPRQVHGRAVIIVGPGEDVAPGEDVGVPGGGGAGSASGREPEPAADAVICLTPRLAAGVLVADCVPVLLADAQAGVVAAAHAGWRGLLAGVLEATVEAMVARGAQSQRLRVALGPAAGACCYEVGEELRAQAAARLPATWANTRAGTPSLDLRAGCRSVLEAVGVTRISLVGGCTIEDESLYSYRRSARTGRFAGVVRMVG